MIHGDTLVLDRWLWLRRHLPRTRNGERVLDVGCGSGAFTIGAALRGYEAVGLSWDRTNQALAEERAQLVGAKRVRFPVADARRLDAVPDLGGAFQVVLCLETAEHILDDAKLFRDMAERLAPGGWLLFTAPNHRYVAITGSDEGPFSTEETGWHVRRGYTPAMLRELCRHAGLEVEEIGYCSFFFSQMATRALRALRGRFGVAGWAATLALRPLPPLLDGWLGRRLGRPGYSITLVAYRPRLAAPNPSGKITDLPHHDLRPAHGVARVGVEAGVPERLNPNTVHLRRLNHKI